MTSKWTEGPWKMRARHPYEVRDGEVVVEMDARPEAWTVWREYRDEQGRRCHRPVAEAYVVGQEWEAAEANAHLIAASPRMYEALRSADVALEEARNVIRKEFPTLADMIMKAHHDEVKAALRAARGEG